MGLAETQTAQATTPSRKGSRQGCARNRSGPARSAGPRRAQPCGAAGEFGLGQSRREAPVPRSRTRLPVPLAGRRGWATMWRGQPPSGGPPGRTQPIGGPAVSGFTWPKTGRAGPAGSDVAGLSGYGWSTSLLSASAVVDQSCAVGSVTPARVPTGGLGDPPPVRVERERARSATAVITWSAAGAVVLQGPLGLRPRPLRLDLLPCACGHPIRNRSLWSRPG
jgi:hypothetical protein